MKTKPRIDGIHYANGACACEVFVHGRGVVHTTRRFRRDDADGFSPILRAMRAAQEWLRKQETPPA